MARHAWKPIDWNAPAGVGLADPAERSDAPGNGVAAAGWGTPPPLLPADAPPPSAVAPVGSALLPVPVALPLERGPRLSPARILAAIALTLGVLAGAVVGVEAAVRSSEAAGLAPTWFAPYVDATLMPTYQFQDPAVVKSRQIVLGFVVAGQRSPCTPSWGGYYSLSQAASTLDLDQRLAQLRDEGIGAVASFGGQAHTPLALACTSEARVAAAYLQVIDRYRLSVIDVDVEGAALTNWAAVRRGDAALATLQRTLARRHRSVGIWLTLPVTPAGLDGAGLAVVREALLDHVRLAGVDVMAMDYGKPVADMGAAAEGALGAVHAQLAALYPRYGIHLDALALWHTLGVTVMIGVNGSPGEVFTTADASQLVGFARSHHLGRVSMWSLNRDAECGSNYGLAGLLSNTCSGVAQSPLQFSSIFGRLGGSARAAAGLLVPNVVPNSQIAVADSPYPSWQPAVPYVAGYKVVWQGEIYEAKWYNQGQDPAADVQYAWQTPWQLIGPVLPGERTPATTTLPPGAYPAWRPSRIYRAGAEVLYAGLPYRAKWYNQGQSPAAELSDPSGSPWQPMFTIPGEPTGSTGG